ncbi:MAG: hypothetical protein CMR00_12770 [[Chlorobium] sp. 445]|nr:MAG: hypothetical protein CMR00_12770 [[Chlorobium] sp. 445]
MTFAERAIKFFSTLDLQLPLPAGVSAMNPYKNPEVLQVVAAFFEKFSATLAHASLRSVSTPVDLAAA